MRSATLTGMGKRMESSKTAGFKLKSYGELNITFYMNSSASENRMKENRAGTNFPLSISTEIS